jgi:hypothetical protein
MTDFYTVLRKSIESRGLSSAEERRTVYDQARRAMIKRLWSHDPPLGEDEISNRIAFFDAAVERIEGDYVAGGAATARAKAETVAAAESRTQSAAVYEGYDEVADYAPTVGWTPTADQDDEPAEPEDVVDEEEEEADGWGNYDPPEVADEEERPEFLARGRPTRSPPPDRQPAPASRRWNKPQAELSSDDGEEEAPPKRKSSRSGRSRRTARQEEDEAEERRTNKAPQRQAKAKAKTKPKKPARAGRQIDRRVMLLSAVIVVLGVVLVGLVFFLVSPHSSSSTVAGGGAGSSKDGSRVITDPATAVQVANQVVNVRQAFTLFDGRDPTVFESSPSNPVQFDHDAGGAFARITSEVESSGGRALIGGGLAQQFAGQTIRVTLVVRSAHESGATKLRFAYQAGVAISPWQVASLTSSFSTIGLIWRVPAQRTSTGDFVLIEPGVPGDGTAADIKSIKIELLAS